MDLNLYKKLDKLLSQLIRIHVYTYLALEEFSEYELDRRALDILFSDVVTYLDKLCVRIKEEAPQRLLPEFRSMG